MGYEVELMRFNGYIKKKLQQHFKKLKRNSKIFDLKLLPCICVLFLF